MLTQSTNQPDHWDQVLKFWFGRVEETIIPSEHRARIWFGEDPSIDIEIKQNFSKDLEKAITGEYNHWLENPRGQLGLILIYDQFTRHIYRNQPLGFSQDQKALDICLYGIANEHEHNLSLIERVFYYFPLLHSEQIEYQEQSVRAYNLLAELAFSETRIIYESFLKFANHHYTLIRHFGRFPQRNTILGRQSSPEELDYLKEILDKGE